LRCVGEAVFQIGRVSPEWDRKYFSGRAESAGMTSSRTAVKIELWSGGEFRVYWCEHRRAGVMRFLVLGDFRMVFQRESNFVQPLQQDVLSEFSDLEVVV
jgi:hypothetical protein